MLTADDVTLVIELLLEPRRLQGEERMERLIETLRFQKEIAVLLERERETLERLAKWRDAIPYWKRGHRSSSRYYQNSVPFRNRDLLESAVAAPPATTLIFLRRNGADAFASPNEVEDIVERLASRRVDVKDIAAFLSDRGRPLETPE